jgi:glycerol-3-phosphate dehydrogenase
MRTVLVERDDFGAGSSSRSTKLVHGGVRYLENAVKHLDMGQYELVREALAERSVFLKVAPHLADKLAILTPLYSWFEVPYMWFGLKVYDWLSGSGSLHPSYYLGPAEARQAFPLLKAEGLKGAVVYYDGQFNDSRMALSVAMTAAAHGAVVLNHTAVMQFVTEDKPKVEKADAELFEWEKALQDKSKIAAPQCDKLVKGIVISDPETGKPITVRAKVVVNAAGPFSTSIRKLDPASAPATAATTAPAPVPSGSVGVHVVLDGALAPQHANTPGLLIPKTHDGRVLFLLPWLGGWLAGTTDRLAPMSENPTPAEEDVAFILSHLREYLSLSDDASLAVKSAWAGVRPLAHVPEAVGANVETAKISREHAIDVSASGLVSVSGGKWTTYRRMAEDSVNAALRQIGAGGIAVGPCRTRRLRVVGAHAYNSNLADSLLVANPKLDATVASHLAHAYGDRAQAVLAVDDELSKKKRAGEARFTKLVPSQPVLRAEVIHAVRSEYAQTAIDVICRRTRIAFLDASAALQSIDEVVQLMGDELRWNNKRRVQEAEAARAYIRTMTGAK